MDAPRASATRTYAKRFTHRQLLSLTAGLVGIQFCWAVQIGYVTKALLELGLSNRFVSYAWLAGPIAGILVQPTVGILSDKCTSTLGRRRPFLIIGTAFTVLCLITFSFARQIGAALGDPPRAAVYHYALIVAVISFWALDFAINAAQGPLRALLADVVPLEQHKQGNAYFAFATGVGNCAGSFLGSLPLSNILFFFPGDLQALYTVAALVLIVTMSITVIRTKETPVGYHPVLLSPSTQFHTEYDTVRSSDMPHDHGPCAFFEAAQTAPYPFFETFTVQCFSWFAWFALFVFATSWVGKEVLHGDFHAAEGTELRQLYDKGVRMGNLGIGLQSVLTIITAPILPSLMANTSVQFVYVLASVMLGCALTSALWLNDAADAWVATAMLASTGFAWAVTMTVPWSLMSEAVSKSAPQNAGVYFTMFNLSQCLPEVMVSVIAERVEKATGRQAMMLALGGVAAFMAGGLIMCMGLGKNTAQGHIDETDDLSA
ncbi:unnamed protein product [Agarophyton chilense]|eukprot:gb/GEZJ01003665.1/.p1 GENE.gb/GEZJ01003665.1/~~gb/GEZJ01003665.1/.p1  ORF type:complete len:489 (-),score=40.27 gb/GEZJ01003665.1/:1382-2848(-)